MEYRPMFFMQIIDAFLVRTEPASSMVKPAPHPHDKRAADKKRERVENELGFRGDRRVRSRPHDDEPHSQRRCHKWFRIKAV